MVRGLNDDDLWHAVVDPDPGNPRRRTLTVWGQGAVNVNTANAQTLLAMVCAYSPDAPQCVDPSMASSFHHHHHHDSGAHALHGHPAVQRRRPDFVATVQGRPPLGPMLAQLGVQPFVVRDPSSLQRSVSTESKVFSIYSEAQVGRAHVRLHAVIDMRAQPMLPSTFMRASGMTVAPTAEGNLGVVSREGGTLLYWRED
jgi:hypothetical protein